MTIISSPKPLVLVTMISSSCDRPVIHHLLLRMLVILQHLLENQRIHSMLLIRKWLGGTIVKESFAGTRRLMRHAW